MKYKFLLSSLLSFMLVACGEQTTDETAEQNDTQSENVAKDDTTDDSEQENIADSQNSSSTDNSNKEQEDDDIFDEVDFLVQTNDPVNLDETYESLDNFILYTLRSVNIETDDEAIIFYKVDNGILTTGLSEFDEKTSSPVLGSEHFETDTEEDEIELVDITTDSIVIYTDDDNYVFTQTANTELTDENGNTFELYDLDN